jgi:uncharacterized protein (DUF983 family)
MELLSLNMACPNCGKRLIGMKMYSIPKRCTNCGYDLTKDYKNDV